MSRKNPYTRFFWSDWRAEPKLKLCSRAARSFWIDLMGLMHDADPYGHLVLEGVAPTPRQLAMILGDCEEDVRAWLAELETAAVFSVTEAGVIYSRRMVRDREKEIADIERGKRGGNPALKKDDRQLELLDGAAREALKKARDRERQARARAKKRAENVTPVTPDVTLQSVTRHVTSRVTQRDEKRDTDKLTSTATRASEDCHGVNRGDKDHSHSHSHNKPLSAPPSSTPPTRPSRQRAAGSGGVASRPPAPPPGEIATAADDAERERQLAVMRRLAADEAASKGHDPPATPAPDLANLIPEPGALPQ